MPKQVVRNWWAMAILDGWLEFAEEKKPQTPEQMQSILQRVSSGNNHP